MNVLELTERAVKHLDKAVGLDDIAPQIRFILLDGKEDGGMVGRWFKNSNTKAAFVEMVCEFILYSRKTDNPVTQLVFIASAWSYEIPPDKREEAGEDWPMERIKDEGVKTEVVMLSVETPTETHARRLEILRDEEEKISGFREMDMGKPCSTGGLLMNFFGKADAMAHGVSVDDYLDAEETRH